MKPEGRKSPAVDPANHKKLSVLMKPQLKFKSSDNIPSKLIRLSPVAQNLLSTVTRTGRLTRQSGTSQLGNNISNTTSGQTCSRSLPVAERSRCLKAPVIDLSRKGPTIPPSNPITPKIMITKCSRLEKLVEERELGRNKKVLRSKVKSPTMSKLGKMGNKEGKEVGSRNNKGKSSEYELQMRKKDSEILVLNRKINSIQKVVSDKEKVIKNLELKFPLMLSDLKKGLSDERKANVELMETIRRNKQLCGDKKQTEGLIKVKDEKLKEVTSIKKKLVEELKAKDLELGDFRLRLETLEKKLPDLLNQIECKEEELGKCKETIEFLEHQLGVQSDENGNKDNIMADMKSQLDEFSEELSVKENEIIDLQADNYDLRSELMELYQNLEETDLETKNYLDIIDNIRERIDSGPVDVRSLHDSIDCLDKATEDFLDKVGAVSKDRNLSLNVKLIMRKRRGGGSFAEQSQDLGGYLLNPVAHNNNNSTHISINNSICHSSRISENFSPKIPHHNSSRNSLNFGTGNSFSNVSRGFITNSFDEVFAECSSGQLDDHSASVVEVSNAESSIVTTDASREDYDVSSDTCMRLEELDNKVRTLWTKLSARDEIFEEFKSDTKFEFSNSVSKMKDELSNSIQKHDKFLTQVRVAKKLFNEPNC